MKPILTWYDQLPEPIRSQAIENYDEEFICADRTAYSLSQAIDYGFNWYESTQGLNYWSDIHDRAIKGEFDIKK